MRDGSLALRHVALKDSATSAAVPVSLFGTDAEATYNQGDVITVTEVYKYKRGDSLSTKPTSTVQVCQFYSCKTIHSVTHISSFCIRYTFSNTFN